MPEFRKIVILGGGGVGKSALTVQFIQGYFMDMYDPTIEDSYRKQVSVDDKVVLMDLLDTAGQEEYKTMRSIYMRAGEGFMIVYSCTSRQSYDEAKALYAEILRSRDADSVPAILIANKSDLIDQREVPDFEGLQFAQRHGIAFIETSALARINVNESFYQIIREVRTADISWEHPDKCTGRKADKSGKSRLGRTAQCSIF
eukprot:TRINITY_DN4614_c0_g1_i1.p1 TRINITY_DN4614_c0_g1~~TRINITY_DN4614_c0_g1_i1.p1  ORF type:complete len:201 (-),score=21.77 TRINITY_DN4614_c0_g1_i1:60-662(-)